MASSSGPGIVTNGLIALIDPANRKSAIDSAPSSLINTSAWAAGQTSSVGVYGANESTSAENARVSVTDPWGTTSIVWQTQASGDGNADGGWNTSYFSIDRTQVYRFSVWVNRTSSTSGGTFYFGTNSDGGVFTGCLVSSLIGGVSQSLYGSCPAKYANRNILCSQYLHDHCLIGGSLNPCHVIPSKFFLSSSVRVLE